MIIQATQTVGMASQLQGSYEEQEERKNESESLTLIDLDDNDDDDDDESVDCGFVSPRQLTKINFRSLIGHTDEVKLLLILSNHRLMSTFEFSLLQISFYTVNYHFKIGKRSNILSSMLLA